MKRRRTEVRSGYRDGPGSRQSLREIPDIDLAEALNTMRSLVVVVYHTMHRQVENLAGWFV